jgi:L-cysteate sulfo-lyase
MQEPSRLSLAHLPTPLEVAEHFSSEMTTAPIWIKRDDCTGLAFGGNKARKLEYLMAAAREAGADSVITFGGVQSNHARSTAAAARRLGLDCSLVLAGSPPDSADGNLLLDRLLGASLTFLSLTPADLTADAVTDALANEKARLASQGRTPYVIAPGGSSALGVLGYKVAFDEMLEQALGFGVDVVHVVAAFGTGGTLAGLILGNLLAGRPARVTGISVAPRGMPESLGVPDVGVLVRQAAELIGRHVEVSDEDVQVEYDWSGPAYGAATTEGTEAIKTLARTEGIFLDPVYTGKAMAGLLGLCRNGAIGSDETVVFIHTGGTPALFPYRSVMTQ